MKVFKLSLLVAVAAIVTFGLSGAAFAFHSGGVAECEGCHTMHNSLEGEPMWHGGVVGQTGPFLLQGTDQSSACLNCHGPYDHGDVTKPLSGSYHIMSAYTDAVGVSNYTPGGDFGWLQKTYYWAGPGSSFETSEGAWHGHNIIAEDYGLSADPVKTVAPGGTYPATKNGVASFGCHSCHDPHSKARILSNNTEGTGGEPIRGSGSYGSSSTTTPGFAVGVYRLLGSVNYKPKSVGDTSLTFTQNAMRAAAKSSYNFKETPANQNRVAYGTNSSEWCANCHNKMHSILSTAPGPVHPTGEPLGSEIAANYNQYVKTGNMNGSSTTSFLSLINFQSDNLADNGQLALIRDSLAGPGAADKVNCFSCHRAHASGFDSMTRFPLGYEFMTVADTAGAPVYSGTRLLMGRTVTEFTNALYGRPATDFAAYQRVLCNKCHAKD